MKRPYVCVDCGATGMSGERGFLPRRCLDCLPPHERRYRERYFATWRTNNPEKYRARNQRSNAQRMTGAA